MAREEDYTGMLAFKGDDERVLHYAALDGSTLALPPYPGDCGLDLSTAEDAVIPEGSYSDIPCGVKVALPENTFGMIVARSSTWTRHGLMVIPGIIDEGWRGDLYVMCYRPPGLRPSGSGRGLSPAESAGSFPGNVIPAGVRLAQLLVLPNLMSKVVIHKTSSLPATDASRKRGLCGFGSSG